MNKQDLILKFTIECSASEIYQAINNVKAWWAEEIEGDTENLNGAFLLKSK